MKRGRVIVVLVGMVVVAMVAAVVWPREREREPVYQGKNLSQWLEALRVHWPGTDIQAAYQDVHQANESIRQIGTNATPWLLKWVGYENPWWMGMARAASAKLPLRLQRKFHLQDRLTRDERRAFRAVIGFRILREQAAAALPELTRLAEATNRVQVSQRARLCVEAIRSPASAARAGGD